MSQVAGARRVVLARLGDAKGAKEMKMSGDQWRAAMQRL